jgi:toxoflavin biosynthesis protein ToxC
MHTIDVGQDLAGNAPCGRPLPAEQGHRSPITCLEFSPDGRALASGSYDGTVKVWDSRTLRVRQTLRHKRLVNGLRWSADGGRLATASADHTCCVWRAATGQRLAVLARHTDDVNSMAWSADGKRLATVSEDGTGRLWNVSDERLEDGLFSHYDHIMSVDWNPSGDVLATCGEDATIRVWSGDGHPLDVWPQDFDLEMCRWSPDGSRLATACDDGNARIFDKAGRLVATVGGASAAVKSVSWSPDGDLLALGVYDGTCQVVETATGRVNAVYQGPRLWPRAVHWNPAGDQIAIGTLDAEPAIVKAPARALSRATTRSAPRRPESRRIPAGSPTFGINDIAVADDVGVLLACDDGRVYRWDLNEQPASGCPEHAQPLKGQQAGAESLLNTVAYYPQASLVAAGGFGGTVSVRTLTGDLIGKAQLGVPVNCVAFNPDRPWLAVADYEGRVTILDVSPGTVRVLRSARVHDGAIKGVSWRDSDHLVTGATDRLIKLLDADLHEERVFTGHGNLIDAVDVSAGPERLIASVSRDKTVRIWDQNDSSAREVLLGHDESLKSLAWLPGSSHILLTGGYDFEARVWDLSHDEECPQHSVVLARHRHGVGAVGWWQGSPVTASWDTSCVVWTMAGGARPARTMRLLPDPSRNGVAGTQRDGKADQ